MENRTSHDESGAMAPSLPSLPARIVQVFVAPSKLFDALRADPAWLGALLLTIGVALLAQFMIPEEMFRDAVLSGLPSDATPEQIEATENSIPALRIFSRVMAVAGPVALFAATAGLLKVVYGVLMGGSATFRQLFATTAHAHIVGVIGGLLTLPVIRATGDLTSTLGMHLLLPGLERATWLFRFLNGLNLFGLWVMVVLGIGISRMYPKVSAANGITFMVGVYVLLKAVLAFAGGGA